MKYFQSHSDLFNQKIYFSIPYPLLPLNKKSNYLFNLIKTMTISAYLNKYYAPKLI